MTGITKAWKGAPAYQPLGRGWAYLTIILCLWTFGALVFVEVCSW